MQARTGRIGLRDYLFLRRVPDVATRRYSYGEDAEIVVYIILDYRNTLREGLRLRLSRRHDIRLALGNREDAATLIR